VGTIVGVRCREQFQAKGRKHVVQETPLEIVTKYAQGLYWPMDKPIALQELQRRGAPEEVLQIIRDMPQERITGPHQIQNALRQHPLKKYPTWSTERA